MIGIAIVEDNFPAQKALEEKLLEFDDLQLIHIARNGSEIISCLSDNSKVDIILMDIEILEWLSQGLNFCT